MQRLGIAPYGEALGLQKKLVDQSRAGLIPDRSLLLELLHVITLGTSSHTDHILLSDAERRLLGIELYETAGAGMLRIMRRGSLVSYPILDLEPDRCDLHRYVRDLEEVLIRTIAHFGIVGSRQQGMTGVWVGDEKIAAIGVRVSSGWITSHGFALNVNTDLRFFDGIVPCGLKHSDTTSINKVRGLADVAIAMDTIAVEMRSMFSPASDRSHHNT